MRQAVHGKDAPSDKEIILHAANYHKTMRNRLRDGKNDLLKGKLRDSNARTKLQQVSEIRCEPQQSAFKLVGCAERFSLTSLKCARSVCVCVRGCRK